MKKLSLLLLLLSSAVAFALSGDWFDDRTAVTASITGARLCQTAQDGRYTITGYIVVTTPASGSSSVGVSVTYTDLDLGVSVTRTLGGFNSGGNPATSPDNSADAGGILNVSTVVNAKGGTIISYNTVYTSGGSTKMQYSIHMQAVAL